MSVRKLWMAMAVTVQVKSYTSIGTQWINPGLRGELQMPKQVQDIKEFLALVNSKDTKSIRVKRNKDNVKFKARTPRFLVTLVVKDTEKAEKLIKLLPPTLKPQYIKSA